MDEKILEAIEKLNESIEKLTQSILELNKNIIPRREVRNGTVVQVNKNY